MVDVFEVPQWQTRFQGVSIDTAISTLDRERAEFYREHPTAMRCVYHRRQQVLDNARCPWGYSWYRVGPDGRLELWRTNWDSSG